MKNGGGKTIIGISMGDPGGIGPEICVKTLSREEIYELCRPLVVGDAAILRYAAQFCRKHVNIHRVDKVGKGLFVPGTVDVFDLNNLPLKKLRHGEICKEQGKASYEYVSKLVELALCGKVQACVTGPINKASLQAAGYKYSGHTEIFAEMTGAKEYAMMLVEGAFRVVHVSTHVSLREACNLVKQERVERVIDLADKTLKRLGIDQPRIGVAGLNPHCGEGGLFGKEEQQEIQPAVEHAKAEGILVEGPIPADTVFSKMRGGMYDIVVVMYHDQGHIPVKLTGFNYDRETNSWDQMAGVNVTLGLPIIRTSVDHGTAFGKAGEGRANPQSMIEAVKLAVALTVRQI